MANISEMMFTIFYMLVFASIATRFYTEASLKGEAHKAGAMFNYDYPDEPEGDIASRTQIKRQQLRRNPYKSAGYVCVVGFEERQVRLSFFQDEV